MKDDKKKSILEEAITDYKEIIEAANVNAKQKLADEFPEKFNKILKGELNKKNKSSDDVEINESTEENIELNENSVMEKKQKATKTKTVIKPVNENMDNVDVQPEDSDVETLGTAVENEDDLLTMEEIENEIAKMEDLDEGLFGVNVKKQFETLNPEDVEGIDKLFYSIPEFKNKMMQQGAVKIATQKTSPQKKYDILQQYVENNGGTIARDTDGTAAYQTKEQMGQKTSSQFAGGGTQGKTAMGGVVGESEELNEIFGLGLKAKFDSLNPEDVEGIDKLFGSIPAFKTKMMQQGALVGAAKKTPIAKKYEILQQYFTNNGGTIKGGMGGILDYESKGEQAQKTSSQFAGGGTQGKTAMGGVVGEEVENEKKEMPYDELIEMRDKLNDMIESMSGTQEMEDSENDEEDMNISDEDLDAIGDFDTEEEIDEMHGVDYAKRRNMTSRGHNPKPENLSSMEKDQSPERFQESKTKIDNLIQDNKKLTKKLNESNKANKSAKELVESYKNALNKYRNQLKEMAVFNTNLAYVNNLLVNEELALTQKDKINIINDFKKISTISESELKYKSILGEMKGTKKSISENIEDKVSTSIQPSSKQKLDEVVEKTAYSDNEHINKIKKLISYTENRGKK